MTMDTRFYHPMNALETQLLSILFEAHPQRLPLGDLAARAGLDPEQGRRRILKLREGALSPIRHHVRFAMPWSRRFGTARLTPDGVVLCRELFSGGPDEAPAPQEHPFAAQSADGLEERATPQETTPGVDETVQVASQPGDAPTACAPIAGVEQTSPSAGLEETDPLAAVRADLRGRALAGEPRLGSVRWYVSCLEREIELMRQAGREESEICEALTRSGVRCTPEALAAFLPKPGSQET